MWTYIVRRLLLMIPTLFGVTISTFLIMRLAPGDPVLEQFKGGGSAGQSTQTREAYLVQKRELKLDRPGLLNFRYYTNFEPPLRKVAHYKRLTAEQIADELAQMAGEDVSPELRERRKFLAQLADEKGARLKDFDRRLAPRALTAEQLKAEGLTAADDADRIRQIRLGLAREIEAYVMVWCENTGRHCVPVAVPLLAQEETSLAEKVGLIKALQHMIVSPFQYTFQRESPLERQVPQVQETWRIVWRQVQSQFDPVDAERAAVVRAALSKALATQSRQELFRVIENAEQDEHLLFREDGPVLYALLQGDSSLEEKMAAAEALRLYISSNVEIDVPLEAGAEQVARVAENWQAYHATHAAEYEFTPWQKFGGLFADTQYAHLLWRLVTFNFGRSALKTRDSVGKKIWDAVVVSAPLMLMAEVIIFGVAIPLGVLCAVNRGALIDRSLQVVLFLLNSIPSFVAGMLFLLFLCYGDYLKLFPLQGLHGQGAENFAWPKYLVDYFWHAALPVLCLSLFSLAGTAMYARGSMLDALGQDYIRTARAKGLSNFKVNMKHGFRNSLIVVLTLFSSFLPALLGGSVLVEYLFGIPGMGRLGLASIDQKDYPTVMALIYIDAIVVMVSMLLTDLLYVFADPRISFAGQGKTA